LEKLKKIVKEERAKRIQFERTSARLSKLVKEQTPIQVMYLEQNQRYLLVITHTYIITRTFHHIHTGIQNYRNQQQRWSKGYSLSLQREKRSNPNPNTVPNPNPTNPNPS